MGNSEAAAAAAQGGAAASVARGRQALAARKSSSSSRRLDRSPIRISYSIHPECKVEAFDVWRSAVDGRLVFRWRPARIREIERDEDGDAWALVAFDGFSERWDVWVRLDEGKIRPPKTARGLTSIAYDGAHYEPRKTDPHPAASFSSSDEEPSFSSLHVETGLEALRTISIFRRRRTSFPPKTALMSSPEKPEAAAAVMNLGFPNLGNTCFMASVLQCLSHCVELRRYFASPQYTQDRSGQLRRASDVNLASAFANLLEAQDRSDSSALSSAVRHLWTCFLEVSPSFKGNRQQDAEEFLVAFLDCLHMGLNRIGRRPTYVELDPPNSLGQDKLASLYWDNYQRGNDSICKDLFAGQVMSRSACLECGANSTSFDAFWEISVSYPPSSASPGVSDSGTRSGMETEEQGFSVKSMLEHYFAVECVPYLCAKCKTEREGRRQLTVTRWPIILVVHVKRFIKSVSGDWEKRVDPVRTDLLLQADVAFRLFGVVRHVGRVNGGHYTSDVLINAESNSWIHCDDDRITEVSESQVAAVTNGYLYFYERVKR